MYRLAWITLLALATGLRAEVAFTVPTQAGSPYSIRISTPLSASPGFGFFPVRVWIQNNGAEDGTWQFEFSSGQPTLFPGQVSSGVAAPVGAGQSREFWYYIPIASPGLVVAPASAVVPAGLRGRPGLSIPVPQATFSTTSAAVIELARRRLAAAGLSGPPFNVSSTTAPAAEPGLNEITVLFAQNSATVALPRPPADRIPPGYEVEIGPGPNGSAVRTFIYREKIPIVGSALAARGAGTLSEASAGYLFRSMGQSNLPATVTQQTMSVPVLTNRSLVVLTQAGPAKDMPPLPAALPAGVMVTMHNAGASGPALRTISYTDPVNLLSLDTSSTISALEAARFELLRRGFLREQPGIAIAGSAQGPTVAASFTVNAGGRPLFRSTGALGTPGLGTTAVITETGPAALLPAPPAGALPQNVSAALAPGARAGEVVRTFTTYYPPGVSAVSNRSGAMDSAVAVQSTVAFTARITGPGTSGDGTLSLSGGMFSGVSSTPPIAISGLLEPSLRSRLAMAGVSGTPNLAAVDPESLPADWRVWSSFHGVILSEREYELLDSARRTALQQWIMFGGRLTIARDHLDEPRVEHVGAGEIHYLPSAIEDLDLATFVDQLGLKSLGNGLPSEEAMRHFEPDSELAKYQVDSHPGYLLVAGFVVCFTIVVVPINLIFLAPGGRRHRLFVTTPVIALGGATLLALIILLRDGTGGVGAREAIVALVPGDNNAAVFQMQSSHLGLVTSGRFPLADTALVAGIGTTANQAVAPTDLSRSAGEARGDWFRSHSLQAYHLRGIVPTRGRVERAGSAPDGSPVVVSTLDTVLHNFVFAGEGGQKWAIPELHPGERAILHRTAAADWMPGWGRENFAGSDYMLDLLASQTPDEPGRWIALGAGTDIAPIETLHAIKWTQSRVAYTGLAAAGDTAATPSTR